MVHGCGGVQTHLNLGEDWGESFLLLLMVRRVSEFVEFVETYNRKRDCGSRDQNLRYQVLLLLGKNTSLTAMPGKVVPTYEGGKT